jgi:hypothetical protein
MFGVDSGGYTISKTECQDCYADWLACHPVGCPSLECPICHSENTLRFVADPPPHPSELIPFDAIEH